MNNMDDTSSSIRQIINNFNIFMKIIENKVWARKATAEMIKNSLKLASFIEKVIEQLNVEGSTKEFLEMLNIWLQENERIDLIYGANMFEYASDHMLELLLCNKAVTIESADIALRIYSSLHPVDRLQRFLKQRILEHSSFNVLLHSIILSTNDVKEIEARMMLKEWEKLNTEGNTEILKQSIHHMFSNFRLTKSLHVLLKILCIIPEMHGNFKDIKIVILEKLQEKLLDHSALNQDFWCYILKELNVTVLAEACFHNRNIFDLLFNFLKYIGSTMSILYINSEKTWISNKQFSLCPDITYQDLFKVTKGLYCINDEMKQIVMKKLIDASKDSSELWKDVLFTL